MNILHIDSSILGENSVSRKLSAAVVQQLAKQSTASAVTYRDLAQHPVPQFSPQILQSMALAHDQLGPEAAKELLALQQVLDEVIAADVVVVGAPMYNFSVPSQLKSWLDALVVPGKTFRYSDGGVEGLLGGKRVLIASSRGGFYGPDSPAAAAEHQESLLRSLFGFIGIADIEVIRAEGVRVSEEHAKASIAAALEQARALRLAA